MDRFSKDFGSVITNEEKGEVNESNTQDKKTSDAHTRNKVRGSKAS